MLAVFKLMCSMGLGTVGNQAGSLKVWRPAWLQDMQDISEALAAALRANADHVRQAFLGRPVSASFHIATFNEWLRRLVAAKDAVAAGAVLPAAAAELAPASPAAGADGRSE